MRHYHISFPLLFLAILAALTFWLDQAVQPAATLQINGSEQRPDYILEDISGLRVNHPQALRQHYQAEKMLHYQPNDKTDLEQIFFYSKELNKPIVRVNADHAALLEGGENVLLTGHVKVVRGRDEDVEKLTMTTHALQLIPAQHLARTDQPVVITRMNTTVKGTGLEFNNRTDQVKIFSRVRAVDLNTKK